MSEEIVKTSTQESQPKVEVNTETPKPVENSAIFDADRKAPVEEKKPEEKKVEEVSQGKEEPKKQTDSAVVPEKIELKLPEKSALNAEALEKISSFAKEQGLSQKQAQALLERENQLEAGRPEALKETNKKLSDSWRVLSTADKEVGGENLTQSVSYAQKALKTFGNETFTKMIDETGLGNHPEVLRFMARVGKAMANDSFVHGDASTPKKEKSFASKFYPNMASGTQG